MGTSPGIGGPFSGSLVSSQFPAIGEASEAIGGGGQAPRNSSTAPHKENCLLLCRPTLRDNKLNFFIFMPIVNILQFTMCCILYDSGVNMNYKVLVIEHELFNACYS